MAETPNSTLRANSVSFLEGIAQTVGVMGPSAGLAVVIPLVYAKAGNLTWLVFAFVLLGFFPLVYIFRIFAARSATAGGLGTFGELAFGRFGGVFVSWAYIVTMIYSVASAAPACVDYAGILAHDLTGYNPTRPFAILLLAVIFIVATTIACKGIKLSTNLMLGIECLSLGAILLLTGWSLLRQPHWIDPHQFELPTVHQGDLQLAFVMGFMCLCGFETITSLGAETQKATQTIPTVILCCIVPLGFLFVAMSYALVLLFQHYAVPLDQSAPFEVFAAQLGLPWLGTLVSAGIILSFFALVLGSINAGARVVYSLAKKGEFWKAFAVVDEKHGSPVAAVILVSGIGLIIPIFVLLGGLSLDDCIGYLMQISALAYIGSYILVTLAAPVFLSRIGQLGIVALAVSILTLAILGAIVLLSIFPVPDWPWNTLPCIALMTTTAGLGATILFHRFRPIVPAGNSQGADRMGVEPS